MKSDDNFGPLIAIPLTFFKRRSANDGVEGEMLMLYLDAQGIEVATGSACTTTSQDPSHVLEAIGVPRKQAYNSIRLTLGKQTTKQQLDKVLKVLVPLITKLKLVTSRT